MFITAIPFSCNGLVAVVKEKRYFPRVTKFLLLHKSHFPKKINMVLIFSSQLTGVYLSNHVAAIVKYIQCN